jgi:hypothetical protein
MVVGQPEVQDDGANHRMQVVVITIIGVREAIDNY